MHQPVRLCIFPLPETSRKPKASKCINQAFGVTEEKEVREDSWDVG
jgi:hypothetical protein